VKFVLEVNLKSEHLERSQHLMQMVREMVDRASRVVPDDVDLVASLGTFCQDGERLTLTECVEADDNGQHNGVVFGRVFFLREPFDPTQTEDTPDMRQEMHKVVF
jgi:hypothetical protein